MPRFSQARSRHGHSVLNRLYQQARDGGTHSAVGRALQRQGLVRIELQRLLEKSPTPGQDRKVTNVTARCRALAKSSKRSETDQIEDLLPK
jgi:hypothetical protein